MTVLRAVAATAVATLALLLMPTGAVQADPVRDLEYWLTEYGFTDAWRTTQGEGVTVAVIDTGINGSVPDLRGAVVGGTDVSGVGAPDGQTPVGLNSQHGTLVASLLAGRGTGDGNGVIGTAPAASLLSVSVALGTSSGPVSTDQQIADGVRWAVDNGADVINMSLTRNSLEWPQSWDDAFRYAFENDVVVVAAAGNRGGGTAEVGAPATIPGVLTVGGVNREGEASFDASSQGITISVAAPSEQLVGAVPGGSYVMWEGTSGAAPLVAGLVALVRSAYPELDAGNVINRIVATAVPVEGEQSAAIYGAGLIDAAAAVDADVPLVDRSPLRELEEWIRLYRRAEPEPAPIEVPPSATAPPIALPPEEAASTGLLGPAVLRSVVIPATLLTGFLLCAALLVRAAARDVRGPRRPRVAGSSGRERPRHGSLDGAAGFEGRDSK